MPEFQERLAYIDKRYEHLRKLTHSLRRKVNELEDIMRQDNDDENSLAIKELLAEIKKERQVMRDEVHIIKGELSQAMYNEDLRKRLTGEFRREEAEKDGQSQSGGSQCEDDVYTPSSSTSHQYRETSF